MTQIDTSVAVRSNLHHVSALSRILKFAGLMLFFAGLMVFLSSLMLADYTVSEQSLSALSNEISPEAAASIQPLLGKSYSSKAEFLTDLDRYLDPDHKLGSYTVGEYKQLILRFCATGFLVENLTLLFWISLVTGSVGAIMYFMPRLKHQLPGIKNDNVFFDSISSRGLIGIVIGVLLIAFYVLLYWYPEYITNMVMLTDPLSHALKGTYANRWFLYGTLYTLAVIVMGVRMFIKYRHSRYHLVRTSSVIFFQLCFAFLIPAFLESMNKPAMDLKNAWPLNYSFFADWNLDSLMNGGNLGLFMLFWGIALTLLVVPVMTYFFGKRWYCSWVCGCGGLAETLGDPFRHLSDKSLKSWRIERITIHSVLVFAVVMTAMQLVNYLSNGSVFAEHTWKVNQAYSFLIGAAFAGVVGTGFYPFMGNRVWCRFGCPLAAILGMVQRFKSRFRITTNGGQCISCGNCSTYCEMGIDVRSYAQRGQNIIRSSCVGCGVCAAVCPRGVLSLENGPEEGRFNLTKMN